MKSRKTISSIVTGSVVTLLSFCNVAWAEGPYDRKPLNVFINFGVGGNTDITARSLMSHMERHLPGDPRIVINNKPGAGGIVGINYVGTAVPKDGYNIGVFSVALMAEIMGEEALTVSHGDFDFIGGIPEDFIFHVRKNDELNEPTDIFELKEGIKSAGHGPASAKDLMLRTTLDLLGVNYENVTGYRSAGDIRAAILKADVDMTADSMTGYVSRVVPNLIEADYSIPLYSLGVPADDGTMIKAPGALEGVPTFDEFYSAKFGKSPSGPEYDVLRVIGQIRATALRAMMIPKGAPEETVAMLREAFKATLADPLYLAEFEKVAGFKPVGLTGEQAQENFNKLMETDPKTIEFLRAYSAEARR